MLDKLKKHVVKIFVFLLNVALAAIAVLVIREKDQARLLEKVWTEKGDAESGNVEDNALPSFENSVNIEKQEDVNNSVNDSGQADALNQSPPADNGTVVPAPPAAATPAPAPVPKKKSPDAKTKTS